MEPTNNQIFSKSLMSHVHIVTHQFLKGLNLKESCHEFERHFAFYFDMNYFQELISQGLWDKLEHYVSGFTSPDNNDLSWELFLDIRKQKYFEALERTELDKAKTILESDLLVILGDRKVLFDELASIQNNLHCLPRIDTRTSENMVEKLSKMVKDNPDMNNKLMSTKVVEEGLLDLAKQNLEAQYSKCRCPNDIWSLLEGHQCSQKSTEDPPVNDTIQGNINQSVPEPASRDSELVTSICASLTQAAHDHFPCRQSMIGVLTSAPQPQGTSRINVPIATLPQVAKATNLSQKKRRIKEVTAPLSPILESTSAGTSSEPTPVVKTSTINVISRVVAEAIFSASKPVRHSLPSSRVVSNPLTIPVESHVLQPPVARFSINAEARRRRTPRVNIAVAGATGHRTPRVELDSDEAAQGNMSIFSGGFSIDELPCQVVRTLKQGSNRTRSMDFHPVHHSLLLVGAVKGELALWSIKDEKKLFTRAFKLWNQHWGLASASENLEMANSISVNQVRWSDDGSLAGVAYTKGVVQVFKFLGRDRLKPHLQFKAHPCNVNDISFTNMASKIVLVTGGDDKELKAWDATTGELIRSFKGHEASIHCVHAYMRGDQNCIVSTSRDGKLKVWSFHRKADISEHRVGPFASVLHRSDGARLFSCVVAGAGKCIVAQLDMSGFKLVNKYLGLDKRVYGAKVHFHTAKNKILAVGHDSIIKYWEMDDSSMRQSTDASIGLESTPIIRFNKDGSLLAATANNCQIKVFANAEGVSLVNDQDKQ